MDRLLSFSKASGAAPIIAFDEIKENMKENVPTECVSKAPQHQMYAALPPCPQANMVEPFE